MGFFLVILGLYSNPSVRGDDLVTVSLCGYISQQKKRPEGRFSSRYSVIYSAVSVVFRRTALITA